MIKMKAFKKLKDRLKGLTDAIARFPLTTVFLLAAAIINAYDISTEKTISKYLLTFVVGAFLSAVAQVAYERYFNKFSTRIVLMGVVILLTAGYYLIIMQAPSLSLEIEIRTAVALFGLLIAFMWVPVIKSKISFNSSFMISFKSLFNSLFFSGVIFAGISIILTAINQLIFTIDHTAYPHTVNIVFIIFAPMYFLSLIPIFPGVKNNSKNQEKMDLQKESIDESAHCPKFLEVLISYILIPLIAVFTLILVIYIIKNIGGEFWTDNLLEPMLVSYAITVILVYILASEIENKFTAFFRKVFPKVLVPIVLFQITSSILSLADTGVTHTRYYVILFGLFAAVSGVLLSFLPVRKNGVIAALLIVFATISIVPPVDAFTVSRSSQTNTLKHVLEQNNMLEKNKILPNESISNKDKQTITNAINYLSRMEYTKKIAWLPDDFNAYEDFSDTFGFKEYQDPDNFNRSVYLSIEQSAPINITGYDIFVQTDIYMSDQNRDEKIFDTEKEGKEYTLLRDFKEDQIVLKLMGENDEELIRFKTQEIYDKFYNYNSIKGLISVDEATLTKENDRAKMTIVVQNVGIEKPSEQNNNALLFVFVQIK
jgi:MFS family permease